MKIQDDVLDMVGTAKDLLVYIANHIDKPKPINITCQKDIDKETLLLLSNFAIKIQRIQTMGIDKKYGIDLQSFDYSNMNEEYPLA